MNKLTSLINCCQRWLAVSLPNRCLLCHQQLSSTATGLCQVCLSATLYPPHVCLGCGIPLNEPAQYCGGCWSSQPVPVVAAASYHSLLGPLVGQIKYQAKFAALPPLVNALAARISRLQQQQLLVLPQAILPVPLHPRRLQQRGFNQAWLIADLLGRALALPVDDKLLRRHRYTEAQAGLSGTQRRHNLQGAFALSQPLPYQRIALVDDVLTTGSTAQALIELLAPFTPDIQIWCLARAEAPSIL